jgi:CheY-like chemotaxis protein
MTMSPNPNLCLLLVEDNEVDREALRRAFRAQHITVPVVEAYDGLEALAILRGEGGDRLRRPHMVLLDLNMPRMNGIELLKEIRADPSLKDTVVFVLTTSRSEEDIAASYDECVAGYLVKGELGRDFTGLLELLAAYTRVVELPEAAG